MNRSSRPPSVALITIGILGTLVCMVMVVLIWRVRGQLTATVDNTLGRVETILTRLQDRAGEANERIDRVRESLDNLNRGVQTRVAALQGVEPEQAADIDDLERRLRARLDQVQEWMTFIRSTAELVEQFFAMLESTSAFLKTEDRTAESLVASIRAGQDELHTAASLLSAVREELADIRGNRNLEERAKRVETITSRIGESLTKLDGYGRQADEKLAESIGNVQALGDRLRSKLTLYATLGTLLAVWMAGGQLALAQLGRRKLAGN